MFWWKQRGALRRNKSQWSTVFLKGNDGTKINSRKNGEREKSIQTGTQIERRSKTYDKMINGKANRKDRKRKWKKMALGVDLCQADIFNALLFMLKLLR